jgi:hypothetical protein
MRKVVAAAGLFALLAGAVPGPGRRDSDPQAVTIDDLLAKLESIKAQKAKLDKAEPETIELVKAKFEQLKQRLLKAGVIEEKGRQGNPAREAPQTYEDIQRRLRGYRVVSQGLRVTGQKDEWYFSCSIEDREDPSVSHCYEARRRGEQGLAAMRAVLESIDQEQAKLGRR